MHINGYTQLYTKAVYTFLLITSIFEFFVFSVQSIHVSLFYISSLLALPLVVIQLRAFKWKPLFIFSLFLIVQIFSLAWSVDINKGLKTILNEVVFLVVVLSTIHLIKYYPVFLRKALSSFFFLMIIPAILIYAFRLYPQLELSFLHSNLSRLFANPNTIDALFNGSPNNVFDENKAGGIFVNANTAAAYFGMAGFMASSYSRLYKNKILFLIGLFLIATSFVTGSKAAIIITLCLATIVLIRTKYAYLLLPCFSILSLIGIIFLFNNFTEFKEEVLSTSLTRLEIWNHFFYGFKNSFFFGQGFGGWAISFEKYAILNGITAAFPPHNTFINTWSESGIFALALICLFYFYIFFYLMRAEKDNVSFIGLALVEGLKLPFLWVVFHGFGENFGPIGEEHMMVILAVTLAHFYSWEKGEISN